MKMDEIKRQSDRELTELVSAQREVLRQERFKDRMSRKASVIKKAKQAIAQTLTELNERRRNGATK